MSGNDFEKQVQQKMDELKFAPSDAVWPAVETQIAERKKRRVLFIWLPFLLFLLGGAAWLYNAGTGENAGTKKVNGPADLSVVTGTNKETSQTPAAENRQQQIKQATVETDSLSNQSAPEKENPVIGSNNKKNSMSSFSNNVPVEVAPHKNGNAAAVDENIKSNTTAIKNTSHYKRFTSEADTGRLTVDRNKNKLTKTISATETGAGNTAGKLKKAPVTAPDRERAGHQAQAEKATALYEAITGVETIIEKRDNDSTAQVAPAQSKSITEAPATAGTGVADDAPVIAKAVVGDSIENTNKTDSAAATGKNKAAGKKRKNIEWGIGVSAGASNISQGFSGLLSTTPAYDATAYTGNLSSTPGTVNNGNNNFSASSGVRPGFAYSVNIFISKPLTKKLQLRAGIGYSYYSNRIEVGEKIDSNKALLQYNVRNSSASAGSVANNYTNRFHFIHLPVTLEQQIGSAGHFSVNGGLAFSWLAGNNALLYDKAKRIYYRDNSQLNKMQLGLLAGFSYRMFAKSILIETGPHVNYGLSNIFKKELYGNRHLFFAGIHTSIFFHKKKQ